MKNSNIQNLALMLMIAMVYSASLVNQQKAKDQQLMSIRETAVKAAKESKNGNITMVKISQDTNPCPDNFFCLAKEALDHAANEKPAQEFLSQLDVTNSLRVYNETYGSQSCDLVTTLPKCNLTQFLDNIKTCVDYARIDNSSHK